MNSTTAIKKVEKETKAIKSQFTMLESEKIALTRSLEEAKAIRDETVAMVASLRSE